MPGDSKQLNIVSQRDHKACLDTLREQISTPLAGINTPSSRVWQYHGESAIFMGGGAAALLQLAYPPVAQAIADHSDIGDIARRFEATFRNIFAMTFGSLSQATTAAERVFAVHTRITGHIQTETGAFAAGHPYAANDRDSLRWVYATLVHTVAQVFANLGRPIPSDEIDIYYNETKSFALLFGLRGRDLPSDWQRFQDYVADMITSRQVAVGPLAKDLAARLLHGRYRWEQPMFAVIRALTAALLPEGLRRDFGLPSATWGRGLLRASRLQFIAPRQLRRLPAWSAAETRVTGGRPSTIASIKRHAFAKFLAA